MKRHAAYCSLMQSRFLFWCMFSSFAAPVLRQLGSEIAWRQPRYHDSGEGCEAAESLQESCRGYMIQQAPSVRPEEKTSQESIAVETAARRNLGSSWIRMTQGYREIVALGFIPTDSDPNRF